MNSLDRNDYHCKKTGLCCRGAAIENPQESLIKSAAGGNSDSRDFLSIFMPYVTMNQAVQEVHEAVEASYEVARERKSHPEDIVFYHCRFLSGNHSCTIYEDRPTLCREYPDSPFTAIAKSCGFRGWYEATKNIEKEDLKKALDILKQIDLSLKIPVLGQVQSYGWLSSYTLFP